LNAYAGPRIDREMADRSGAGIAAMAIAVAACCPRALPQPPPIALVPATCARSSEPRAAIPTPVASRLERAVIHIAPKPPRERALEPVEPATRAQPPIVAPAGPKQEIDLSRREPLTPPTPPPPTPTDTLPDEVVLKLLESGRAVFARCFKHAVTRDPLTVTFKVRVHVVLDASGTITSAKADTSDPTLASCLVRGAGWLRFPASGRPIAVDLPLFYRAE
jgi:hypothetical protein